MDFPKFLTTNRRTRENRARSEEGGFAVERREHPRHILEFPMNYSDTDGKERWGIAADASEGGVLVYLPEGIEKGALLKIEMFFPKGSELNTIKAMAKVVWSDSVAKKAWGKYKYGLAFQVFHKGSLDKLKILLKETAKSQSALTTLEH
jgi:hypothetical protein